MEYIVVDAMNGAQNAFVLSNEEGEVRIFDTPEEAQAEADECQHGVVVPIPNFYGE